ncbi:MAG: cysteine desulfurase [Bryobacteraceae bacterium]|nr:cysteine desulfurase [Bryobacteraceae bacterium]
MTRRIYLDFNASTPIAPEVAEQMQSVLTEPFGNPSSGHWAGAPARETVERARAQVAALLACDAAEIVFTSGGSEANNHALKGTFYASPTPQPHIITIRIEHPAILRPCRFLERLGASVTYLPVDGSGRLDPDDVRRAITSKTILISVMHANNEVGTIQPLLDISRIAREHEVLFHTDAAQTVGKIPARVTEMGVDLLSVAGHKLYAPKGVGALYIRKGVQLEPLVHGAGHEAGRRAGTENVLLDVGLGAACELAQSWVSDSRILELRDLLWSRLEERFGDRVVLNGHPTERLPNTLNMSFMGASATEILAELPDLAASTGSACHSGAVEPSPVLTAMGVPPDLALGAVRFSLGRTTTAEEIEEVVDQLSRVLARPAQRK